MKMIRIPQTAPTSNQNPGGHAAPGKRPWPTSRPEPHDLAFDEMATVLDPSSEPVRCLEDCRLRCFDGALPCEKPSRRTRTMKRKVSNLCVTP